MYICIVCMDKYFYIEIFVSVHEKFSDLECQESLTLWNDARGESIFECDSF